ncbi:hypothetical protein D3C86_1132950 [compost metagenome]
MTLAWLCHRSASEIRGRQPSASVNVQFDMRLQTNWSPELRPVLRITACQKEILDSLPLNGA